MNIHLCKNDETLEQALEYINEHDSEGRKYTSRTAFANGSYSAWKVARLYGWINEMTWLNRNKK